MLLCRWEWSENIFLLPVLLLVYLFVSWHLRVISFLKSCCFWRLRKLSIVTSDAIVCKFEVFICKKALWTQGTPFCFMRWRILSNVPTATQRSIQIMNTNLTSHLLSIKIQPFPSNSPLLQKCPAVPALTSTSSMFTRSTCRVRVGCLAVTCRFFTRALLRTCGLGIIAAHRGFVPAWISLQIGLTKSRVIGTKVPSTMLIDF